MIKAIDNLVYAYLIYLSENVENVLIDANYPHIDDLLANVLIYSIDDGFAYADKSYDLVEYGIRRGHSIRRPKDKPERQVLARDTDEDIDFNGFFN